MYCLEIHRYQNGINQGGHPIALVSMVTTSCEKSLFTAVLCMGCHFIYTNGGRARFHSLCMRWNSSARWQLLRNACFSRPRCHGRHCCKWNAWNSRAIARWEISAAQAPREWPRNLSTFTRIAARCDRAIFSIFGTIFGNFPSSDIIGIWHGASQMKARSVHVWMAIQRCSVAEIERGRVGTFGIFRASYQPVFKFFFQEANLTFVGELGL